MSLLERRGEPITIVNRVVAGIDRDGNDYTTASTQDTIGLFAPAGGYETTDQRDQVSQNPQAYLPAGVTLDSSSVLTIRGLDYEVDGEPGDWQFGSWAPGVQVQLKRVSG